MKKRTWSSGATGAPATETCMVLPTTSSAGAVVTTVGPKATARLAASGLDGSARTSAHPVRPQGSDPPAAGTSGSCTTTSTENDPAALAVTGVPGPHRAAAWAGVGSSR
jgi:hypothetical protein